MKEMKIKTLLFLCVLLCTACHNAYIDKDLEQHLRALDCKKIVQLEELTNYMWDTLYVIKPYGTLERAGIKNAPRALKKEIGAYGPREGFCVLVFSLEGEVVKYAQIPYDAYDFHYYPDILTPESTISKGWVAENVERFYHNYINHQINHLSDPDSLYEGYMGDRMRAKIKRLSYSSDVDPLTRSQDVSQDMLKTLDVKCLGRYWYMVSFFGDKNDSTSMIKIPVQAMKYKDGILITYITPWWNKDKYGRDILSYDFTSESQIDHTSALTFLTSFYKAYGTVYATGFSINKDLPKLRAHNLSKTALAQFKKAEEQEFLDCRDGYDLLFNDFDFDKASHHTMQFKHVKDDDYQVSYAKGDYTVELTLTVKKVQDKYVIDSIKP